MRQDTVTMTLAICASLAVHGTLATVLWVDAARAARINPAAAPAPPPPADAPILIVNPEDPFGSATGHGNAPNEFTSDQKLNAPAAPHPQAFLSRDPQGPGRIGNLPAPSLLPPAEHPAGQAAPKLEQTTLLADTAAILPQFGPASALDDLKPPYRKTVLAPHPSAANPIAPKPQPSADAAPAHHPGSAAPAADPAPMSDSESDPFSGTASVTISPGDVEAHLGRKVKTVRPRLSLAAQIDLVGLQFPKMRLRVHLDADGKVTKVKIVKSSGSESADQEVKVAVYQWQFAPRKVKSDSPDIVSFDIDWR